ncbi:hypothetical protein [Phenylobacterium ferrooxidans]|uniref:Minor tail protein n=1 Tax=Phenylobacterium ferrooxidans TaxID=2982689 RepID=A0ABW6CNK9_9CAUL
MADKKLLLIKAEVTPGLDPVAAAVDVVWALDVSFKPKGDRVGSNPAMAGLGGVKDWMVGEYGELTFSVPLGGSGTAGTAPKWGKLLLMSGYAETVVATTSVTYALAANPAASATGAITWREGRRLHKLAYARGFVNWTFDEKKQPIAKFTFRGIMTAVADGAVIGHADATWTGHNDVAPVNQANTIFTFGGASPPLRSLSIEQTDNVSFHDRPNQKTVEIAGERMFSGSLKIGSLLPSVLNLEAVAKANTLTTITLVHGVTAGSILTVTAKAQAEMPDYSDENGIDVTTAGLKFRPSAQNLDDQLAIVCT